MGPLGQWGSKGIKPRGTTPEQLTKKARTGQGDWCSHEAVGAQVLEIQPPAAEP